MKVDRLAPALSPPGGERGFQAVRAPRSFAEVLGRARPPPPSKSAPPESGVRRVLQRASAAEARVDVLLEAAARGKTFTPGELLALQAAVFRWSQTVEVVSRAADRLVGAVKQTIGTQV
jgi:hypothetical protein